MLIGRVIKQPGEIVPLTWGFASELAAGETIASVNVTATLLQDGTSAAALLSGSPDFATVPGQVTQKITGGVSGKTYSFACEATTNANLKYEHEIQVDVVEE